MIMLILWLMGHMRKRDDNLHVLDTTESPYAPTVENDIGD